MLSSRHLFVQNLCYRAFSFWCFEGLRETGRGPETFLLAPPLFPPGRNFFLLFTLSQPKGEREGEENKLVPLRKDTSFFCECAAGWPIEQRAHTLRFPPLLSEKGEEEQDR